MKKFLAIAMSMLMVLSMVACGDSSTSTTAAATTEAATTAAATTEAATTEAATTAAADEDPYAALEPVEMIGADACAIGAAGNLWFEAFNKYCEEITGGKLTVDYHPNSELGGDADVLRQVQSGDIQVQVSQTAPAASFVTDLAVFDCPMIFASNTAAEIDEAINGDNDFTAALSASFEAQGFKLLGFLQGATFRLTTSNIALNSLEDFAGLKIRTMENSNHLAFWKALGADPQPLAFAELYDALRLGTYDAQENAADTCANSNFQEVQKYLCLTNHILYNNQMTINKEFYDSLDPLYQAAIDEAFAKATADIASQLTQIDIDNKDKLVAGGIEIIEYEPEFYDSILANEGVQELYTKIDTDTNGLVSKLQAALQ